MSKKTVPVLVVGLLIGGAVVLGLLYAGVFDKQPGVQIDGDGVEVNLPR